MQILGGMRDLRIDTVAWVCLVLVWLSCVSAAAAAVSVECYQFTWEQDKNDTDCDEQRELGIPCFEPFILTVPQSAPPNITDLEVQCNSGRECATYTCIENKQCVRYVRYNIRNEPLYISVFCGAIVDVTKVDEGKEKTVTDSCYKMKNGTITIQACSCSYNKCNGFASRDSPCHFAIAALVTLLLWRSFFSDPFSSMSKN